MSYGVAAALQEGVYQALVADTDLAGLVSGAIYDVVPAGSVPGTYVSLGPEDASEQSDGTGGGAVHRITVSVVTDAAGFQTAKQVAAAVSDCLDNAALGLNRGRLVSLNFLRAKARRMRSGEVRRIDLTFRARVEDDLNN